MIDATWTTLEPEDVTDFERPVAEYETHTKQDDFDENN